MLGQIIDCEVVYFLKKKIKKIIIDSKNVYICIELIINLLTKSKMKKVFLSLALVAAMSVSFVSCKEKEAEGTEETMEEVAPEATEEVAPEATEEVTEEAAAH
uniref:hypothetical protein n=1 Tax=Flavobacterium sp. TaxID=239 RepID=UPI00404AB627